jgi:calcineurin-like phosphoesterase family protein
MKNRRDFLKMSAGALALGSLHSHAEDAAAQRAARRIWFLSDLHCGHAEDGKDGAGWFSEACEDMKANGIGINRAFTLGDLTHHGNEEQLMSYLKIRSSSGIAEWHELAGNHEYEKNRSIAAYEKMIRSIQPYCVLEGNVLVIMLSDEKGGVEGNLSEDTCVWLENELAKHRDKVTIVCSHQLVKGTVVASEQKARHLHPAERIQDIITKSKIDLWLCGHEHHTPYTPKHIVRRDQTTYINVASMNHAYGTKSSQSAVMELVPGRRELVIRRRDHDKREFLPEFEVKVPLRGGIELPQT